LVRAVPGQKRQQTRALALQLGLNDVPYFSSIELTSSTPFIDFHFGKDPADYTARIIQTEANALEVGAGTGSLSFRINGGLRVGGVSYAGGINIYRGNGDANALWGLNCSDGNLNIARGLLGDYRWATPLLTALGVSLANRAVAVSGQYLAILLEYLCSVRSLG
jgi:hypothetical protein